ncbi:MAG TPA: cytochrome c3 family protein [Kofleriaceae bacterium]|nr:cytochrome c3 family protein [Kofleriaceae bacterium]
MALFTSNANVVYRAVLLALALALAAAICAPMIYIRTRYAGDQDASIAQPVEFDHRHHARDDGIDCVYCHDTVETEASAGIPSTARCMGCHGQVWTTSPELEPVRRSWRTGVPIHWKRVNALPGYVYFHHGVHIQAGLACAQCHGEVRDMPRVYRAHDLSMKFCLDCHRERQDGRAMTRLTSCTTCHR